MAEKAKIIVNKYTALEMLKQKNINFDNFFTGDLKIFCIVAKEEIDRLNYDLSEYKRINNKTFSDYDDVWKNNVLLTQKIKYLENLIKSICLHNKLTEEQKKLLYSIIPEEMEL